MLESLKKHKSAIIVFYVIIILLSGLVVIVVSQKNEKPIKEEVQTNERNVFVAQLEVTTEYINIRAAKSVNSDILGKVKQGEIYTIISEDAKNQYHWYEIETSNGIKGFISGANDYVKVLEIDNSNSPNTEPTLTPDETQSESNSNTNTNTKKPNSNKKKPNTNTQKPNSNTQKPNTNNNNTTQPNTNTNTSDNNNDEPNTSNNNTPATPQPVEKKVIDARVSKRCPSGYKKFNFNEDECWRNIITENKPTLTCPSGYKLKGTDCVEVRPTLNAKAIPICASGAEPTYATNGQWFCRDGSRVIPYRCPSGYKLDQKGSDYICVYTNPKIIRPTATCPNDEGASVQNGEAKCFYTETVPKKVYSCPSGYTLKGDKCYEN